MGIRKIKHYRTTISIPLDLKEEMNALEEAGFQVNWSAIAAEAFRDEVYRLRQVETQQNLSSASNEHLLDLLEEIKAILLTRKKEAEVHD